MKKSTIPKSLVNVPHVVSIQYHRPAFDSMVRVTESSDAYQFMLKYLNGESLDYKERIWLITLNGANRILTVSLVSVGTVNASLVPNCEILQTALLTNASGIVLIHNHPSGKLEFSESDIRLTHILMRACKSIGIALLDHIVITSENFISMAEEKLIEYN